MRALNANFLQILVFFQLCTLWPYVDQAMRQTRGLHGMYSMPLIKQKKNKKKIKTKKKSAQDEQAEQAAQNKAKPPADKEQQNDNKKSASALEEAQKAEQLSREEKIAADQWLRRIEDNPGDLLQRKFRYQYQQRQAPEGTIGSNPW